MKYEIEVIQVKIDQNAEDMRYTLNSQFSKISENRLNDGYTLVSSNTILGGNGGTSAPCLSMITIWSK